MNELASQKEADSWVNENSDLLFRFALHRVKDEAIAKDLVQDTFMAAWKSQDSFKGDASIKNWLFGILKNKIVDHYRKNAKHKTDQLIDFDRQEESFFNKNEHWKKDTRPQYWEPASDSELEQNEFYDVLGDCQKRLKEIQQAVFSLKYLDGLDSSEIVAVLGITESNYWVLMHRAKMQLRSCLEKNWFEK